MRLGTVLRLLLALGAVALTTLLAAPAHAHASLVDSSPRQGASLDALPTSVSFEFSDRVLEPAYVVVTGPDGESVATGAVSVDGTLVRQDLVGDAPDGSYTMAYRVVSEDGHPVSGEITFSVGATTADDPAAASDRGSATNREAPDIEAGSGPSRGVGGGVDLGLVVGVALFAGAGLLWLLSRRTAP